MPSIIPDSPALLCCVGAVQVLGLLSAALTRLAEGSRRQSVCQWLFFVCLGLVGLGTIVSLGLPSGWWVASGATLSMMVVTATWDFGRSRPAEAW
jgi:hypothetical protein